MIYFAIADSPVPSPPSVLTPTQALIFYQGERDGALLHYPVHAQGDAFKLGAGSELSPETVTALLRSLGAQDVQPVGERSLGVGPGTHVWWVPPGVRAMQFDAKYAQTRDVREFSGVPLAHPGLVMRATPNQLAIWAVRGSSRPALKQELCHAPYWNMFSSGVMCQGTVRYPEQVTVDTLAQWEAAFFQSLFTGPSRQDKYMNWGSSYSELLARVRKEGAFPEDVLVDSGLTLASLVT